MIHNLASQRTAFIDVGNASAEGDTEAARAIRMIKKAKENDVTSLFRAT
jgi:hypothetical protein